MPKNTNKSTKSTKVVAAKKTESKKSVQTKKTVKKVETKKPVEVKTEEIKVAAPKPTIERNNVLSETKLMDNTPFVIALCVIVILAAGLIFTLCVKRVPKNSKGEEIIATLKGKEFTANELYEALKEDYGTDALMKLVDNYITSKEVKITKEDKEYVQQVVDYYKGYAENYNVDLQTFLVNYVGLPGITTEKEFYDFVLNDYKKTLAAENIIIDNADEKDLKEFYKENYTDKLTVKHILIEVDPDAEDEDEADQEALDKANELIDILNNTSADELDSKFDELAEDNSDDTATYSNGGLVEDFTKKDVVEEFYNAAKKLKDGQYTSEAVKTVYGYHIILKVSSTPAEKYKDIKDEVKKAYAESQLSADATLISTKWEELRKQYKFSIKDDFLKKAYKNSLNTNNNEE